MPANGPVATPTSAEPLDLQLAIQGGGAKISALLAVAEALQDLQREGQVRLRRIAGTSAGAIVGALLAYGVPAAQVRARLKNISLAERQRIFPPMPSKFAVAAKLLFGNPIWNMKPLVDLLNEYIPGDPTLDEVKRKGNVELIVLATDLTNRGKKVYDRPDDKLVNAVRDSAAVPFFYRTWSYPSQYFDGGICENLPSEILNELEQTAPTGAILVGILFKHPKAQVAPTTMLEFSKALLDAAIENSMTRARSRIRHAFTIQTEVSTFDFEKAFNEGLGPEYELIRLQAKNFFSSLRSSQLEKIQVKAQPIKRDLWSPSPIAIMSQLADIYERQHASRLFRYEEVRIEVSANCLAQEGEPTYGIPDEVVHRVSFSPSSEPLFCHRFGLGFSSADARPEQDPSWSLMDSAGVQIEAVPMPIKESTAGQRRLVLFFTPPLEPGDRAPYVLRVVDWVSNTLGDLKKKGEDALQIFSHRVDGRIGKVNLVVHVPVRYSDARILGFKSSRGRPMNAKELQQFPSQGGFKALGWTDENVDMGIEFGAAIVIPSAKKV